MSLAEIRKSKKLTLRKAVELLLEVEPTFPTSYKGLDHIERRGTDRIPYIRALSKVYNVPEDVIEAAASRSKLIYQNGQNSLTKN